MDLVYVEELVKSKNWGVENGDGRRSGGLREPFVQQIWQRNSDQQQQQQQSMPESFQKSAPNDAKMAAVLFCDVLGVLCILLNAFVILALLRNRQRVLINVFYVLVLHCAVVDLIRGGCLIAWGMPHLLIHTLRSIDDRLNALKINQFTLVILRSCNMLTIFNLLVFTTNEFIVIKYPLHYRRYFCRRTVVLILAICWLISLLFGIGSVFANIFDSSHLVLVQTNITVSFDFQKNEKTVEEEEGVEEGEDEDGLRRRMDPSGVQRRQMAGLSINVLCMLMIFVLCYVCLFTVLICYGKILRTIRQFQRHGGDGRQRTLAISMGSQKTQLKTVNRGSGSIYHKRSVHQQRNSNYHYIYQNEQQQMGESNAKREDSRRESQRKKVSVPGTPQSQNSLQTNCGRCANCAINSDTELGKSRRCNSHRKWRSHLMSRHKYLIVIGTVLFVDILFLFPYSGIQMVALLHLNNLLATSNMTTLIRWCLQILIGVHSVCQPLCYFRMTEFRRLACCLGEKRRFGGSGSSAGGSVFGGVTVGTISRATTKGNKNGAAAAEEPQPITKKSIVLRTVYSQGISPTAGGGEQREERERANWTNPTLDGQQMLLITQRRRWTRNLSLLCKEEGEELEMFLAKEYRKRTVEKYGNRKSEEKESDESEEKQAEEREDSRKRERGGGSLKEERTRRKRHERKGEGERAEKMARNK